MAPRTSWWAIVVLGLASSIGAMERAQAQTARQDAFPYTAYITSENVQARSGPGKNYYATSKLERGAPVEVYRHDPGGWYAIRPPEGSFSWVTAKHVEIKGDGVGVITADRVAARVGSDMSDIRDVIQVQLDQGEEVRVLEARKFGTGASAQTWYRVAPPAGEFRWVFGQYVGMEPPVAPVAVRDARRNRLIERTSADGPALETPVENAELEEPAETAPQQTRPEARRAGAPEPLPDVEAEPIDEAMQHEAIETEQELDAADAEQPVESRKVRPVAERRLLTRTPLLTRRETRSDREDYAAREDRSERRPPERLAARGDQEYRGLWDGGGDVDAERDERYSGPVRSMSAEEQNSEIDRLNEDLSRMVSGSSNRWNLGGILRRAEDVMKLTDSALVRARARRLLEQCERFEDIRRRQLGIAQPSAVARHSNLPVLSGRQETTFDRLGVGSNAYAPTTTNVADRLGADRYADRYSDRAAADRAVDRYADRYASDRYDRPGADRYTDYRESPPRGPSAVETAGRYDGAGKLTPVLSQKIGEPHYALVDERGSVRYYVTAAPGVNLRRYVGQDVGITGTRAFSPELNTEHLTARRIFPLEGARTMY